MAETAILEKRDGEVRMNKDFSYLTSKLANGRYKVTIVKCSEKRTISQNDLMWMWFKCIEDETGQPKKDVYLHYCKKFLSRIVSVDGKDEEVYDTSSGLNTKRMSEFMTKIQVDAAIEFGMNLPSPEDRYFDDFINEYNR